MPFVSLILCRFARTSRPGLCSTHLKHSAAVRTNSNQTCPLTGRGSHRLQQPPRRLRHHDRQTSLSGCRACRGYFLPPNGGQALGTRVKITPEIPKWNLNWYGKLRYQTCRLSAPQGVDRTVDQGVDTRSTPQSTPMPRETRGNIN